MKRLLIAAFLVVASATANAQTAEVCNNGTDDNSNGLADEGCFNLSSGQCESPLSCSETGSVSPKKGVLRYVLPPDVAPKVPYGPGIGMRRTYISSLVAIQGDPAWKTPLGDHWTHNYQTWISHGGGTFPMVIRTSQGQDVYATYTSSSGGFDNFKPQIGFHVQSIKHRQTSPFDYQIRLLTGATLVYNTSGRLTEIQDVLTTNKVTLAYDGNSQVDTVTDASGMRRLQFSYNSLTLALKGVHFQTLLSGSWVTQHSTDYSYDPGATADSTSRWYVPANATEWTSLLKGSGISNPSSLWLMQETTGSLADSIGTRTATLAGSATYQVTTSGWTRKGVKITTDNSTSVFSHTIPTASTNSLAYVQIFSTNTTPGSGFRALSCIGSTQYEEAQLVPFASLIGMRAQSGANTSSGTNTYSGTMVVVTKLDHSRSEFAVYTDKETLKPTFVNQSADTTSLLLGDGLNSSDATLLYAGMFTGVGAEFSDAQAQALIKRVKKGIGLTSVTIGGQLAQVYAYGADGQLNKIADANGNNIISFKFSSTTNGQTNLIETPRGVVGFDYVSTRANCQNGGVGQTVLYFNKGSSTSCSADTDCGSGFLCGGKTATGPTGTCFRAARCLTVSSPSEDVVTNVAPIGPPSEPCEGACAEIAQYVWNTFDQFGAPIVDLKATQDAMGNYTSREFDANGLPTHISYGDLDSNPTNGNSARDVYLFYDATFPGKLTEIRHQSELDTSTCTNTPGVRTGCAYSRYLYDTGDGTVRQMIQGGSTLNSSAGVVGFTYTTFFSYDTFARLTQIDGPVSGNQTILEYWATSDLKNGFVHNYKRKKDATTFVVTAAQDYDFWGNRTTLQTADTDTTHTSGTVTCLTYSASRGYLASWREAMAGQTDCSTSNGADLTTSWMRDSALRLAQITRADSSCLFFSYDANGRLVTTKRRDDCNAASAGDSQSFLYDADGLLTEIDTKDASSVTTAMQLFSYFDGRQLKSIINPVDASKSTGLIYDARGSLQEIDGAGNIGRTVYHRDGTVGRDNRVTSVDRYKDATLFNNWSLLYDWGGAQKQVTDGDSKVTQSVRDDRGRIVKLVSPDMTYPTVFVFDEASRLVTKVDAQGGGASQQTHTFTFDNLGRPLNAEFYGTCPTGTPHAEIQRVYDAPPVTCPVTGGCKRTSGRLAYVKATLLCSSAYSGTDGALDQETFYSYDDAGRMIGEYIVDDSGRIANLAHAWTPLGSVLSFTGPSGTAVGAVYGTTVNNSDSDLPVNLWRTNSTSKVTDNTLWFPFGPLKQYDQQNKISNKLLRTRITRNLAYRITAVYDNEPISGGAANHQTVITEDARGRVTVRDYTPNASPAIQDSYFLYDQQDRVTCENAATITGSCPLTGTNLKNNLEPGGFTNAGDWNKILRPIAGTSPVGYTNQFNPSGYGTSHQVTVVRQSDGTPAFGDTTLHYDPRGNRDYDDNAATLTHDRRDYTFDGRGNLVNVHGQYSPSAGVWHDYDLASSFDAENRRVFKSFLDNSTGVSSQWFFYYDASDRLTEVRYFPNAAATGTYSYFQLSWMVDRFVYYAQTDTPSGTLSRRYIGTDEIGRPVDMFSWPSTGSASRVWSINPSAWGFDKNLVGPTIFQPVLFAGQFSDVESVAFQNDGTTAHRPALALNGFRTYDPFLGAYLQVDPRARDTWSSYVYVDTNPVGESDPRGLMITTCYVHQPDHLSVGGGDFEDAGGYDEPYLCDDGTGDDTHDDTDPPPSGGGGAGGGAGGGGSAPTPPPRPEVCTVWDEALGNCTRPHRPTGFDCTFWGRLTGQCATTPAGCEEYTTDEACTSCKIDCFTKAGCSFGGVCVGAQAELRDECINSHCHGDNAPCGALCIQLREAPPQFGDAYGGATVESSALY